MGRAVSPQPCLTGSEIRGFHRLRGRGSPRQEPSQARDPGRSALDEKWPEAVSSPGSTPPTPQVSVLPPPIVITRAMEHCDDTVMEHCHENNSGALC